MMTPYYDNLCAAPFELSLKYFSISFVLFAAYTHSLRRKKEGNAYNISLILQWFDWHAIID